MLKEIEYKRTEVYLGDEPEIATVRATGDNIVITLAQKEMDNIYEELDQEFGDRDSALAILGQYGIDIIGDGEDYGV